MAKKKAKPKPNSGNPPKKKKNPLTEHWFVCIVIPLLAIASGFVLHYLPDKELPTIIFESNPPLQQAREKVDEGNDGDALPFIQEAITLDPTNPQSYLLEAEIMLRQGHQPEAVQALDAAAKAVPKPLRKTMRDTRAQVKKSTVDGYIGISSTYEKFGLRDIAIALLVRVCAELPEEGRLREALARLLGSDTTEPTNYEEPDTGGWLQAYVDRLNDDAFTEYGDLYFALLNTDNHDIPILLYCNDGANSALHRHEIYIHDSNEGFSSSGNIRRLIDFYRRRNGTGIGIKQTRVPTSGFGNLHITYNEYTGTLDLNEEDQIEWTVLYNSFDDGHFVYTKARSVIGGIWDSDRTVEEFFEYAAWFEQEYEKLELILYVPGMNIEDAWIH